MAGITGLGSGIDIGSIVKALVDAERAPKQSQLNRLEKATSSRISALGTMRSVIGEFSTTLSSLNKLSAFQKQTVSSTSSSVLTATSTGTLPAGRFSMQVQQVASSSKAALQSVAGTSAATFNSGSLNISAGSSNINIDVTATNNSLLGIRDAINTAGSSQGIGASIVSDASGSRLVVSSNKTGAGNDIQVVSTADGVTQGANSLGALNFSSGTSSIQLPTFAAGAISTFKAGTLSLNNGTATLDISVAEEASLEDIRDAINLDGAAQGFSATLESVDGGAARLMVQSNTAGPVSVTSSSPDSGLGDNNLSALNSVALSNARSIDTAKSAMFTVDGLSVVKNSNTITDVIEGITINLVAAQSAEDITAGKTVDVVVGQDKASVRSSLQKFVEGYNKLMQTNNDLTAVVQVGEGKPPVTGPLLGDSSLRNLLTGLRKEMTQLGDQAGLSSLAELGITTQKDGKLSIDAVKMDEALAANYDKVAEFMTGEKGLMGRLEGIVKPYANDSGILGLRQKSLQTTLSSVDKQRAALDLRIEKVQERLFSQYNAMDMLVGRLQKTSESLANQLASLPGFVRKDK
ncbi:flagellar filament capping protein FliD [Pseudomonas sp. TMP25]|uniref:flagellar filament capping protein FliD n=1 Tax=Pseudomonas sp. TMP25 TaxID=3136561 RepID=UPI003101164D